MKIKIEGSDYPSMGGMGAAAWDRSDQNKKVSMHPPLPEHVECVEEQMKLHSHKHHDVHRRHPENDCDEEVVGTEIPLKYLRPLMDGKDTV